MKLLKSSIVIGLSTTGSLAFSPSTSSLSMTRRRPQQQQHRAFQSSECFPRETSLYSAVAPPEQQTTTDAAAAAAVESSSSTKSWADDGFVFGLEGSGLQRPKGRTASIVVEGDSLETQPYQVTMVAGTFSCHALFLAHSFQQMLSFHQGNVVVTSIQAVFLLLSSWVLADFGSGVLHWSVDNYGNGRTPIMGGIIAAFQGHHSAPWTITQRGFCNNVYKLCIPFGPVTVALLSLFLAPSATFFTTVFCAFEILSQEFHKWSHQLKSESPSWVNWMQSTGISIGRKPHAQHHLAPFEGNYCIISGICNTFLDQSGFFRRLEHIVYKLNGAESNAWKLDQELKERTLKGDYAFVASSSAAAKK